MSENLHSILEGGTFVSVVLPLALSVPYTYLVPEELIPEVQFGKRVEVQFGKSRLYTAIVVEVHNRIPEGYMPKTVISVVDEQPILTMEQYRMWKWLSSYYCCSIGEVMNAALPANLKLASETLLTLSPEFDENYGGLEDEEFLIAEALSLQKEISIEDVRGILGYKTVYPLIKRLLEKNVVFLKEDLKEKYKAKKVGCVKFQEPYLSDRSQLTAAFELVSRSSRQTEALMAYLELSRGGQEVRKTDIYKRVNADSSVLNAIAKKGIFELYDKEISRLGAYEEDTIDAHDLSAQQVRAMDEIKTHFAAKDVVLLHGVTGSGKTRVYIELIREAIKKGEQTLYLLPEIALTTQIISRLQKVFGDQVLVYHSRMSNNERVELWNKVLEGAPVVLGARSALFLPYRKLRLLIVDEEHDQSYKQQDPNPRYQGRDAAVVLAQLYGAKTLLGTATPSMETYFNAKQGKYGLVEMPDRYGEIELPEVFIANAKEELKQRKLQSHFTTYLIDELKALLERGEQAILFQNRRGYSPTYRCDVCDWHSECIHCDVSLTYHKFHNNLKCHYCGYQTSLPPSCPACGSKQLTLRGFGTEKIEDELKIYLPDAKIGRMDLDTVRTKNAHSKLINDFEEGRLDILVGTQMVTKGLDFDNVGLVAVLSADQLLQFPDFRAGERGFQLITQVSGRAGRRKKRGKVIVQAFNISHPVLKEVVENDFPGFYQRELMERHEFQYPPYARLIRITLKHKKPQVLNEGGRVYETLIRPQLGDRLRGPAVPYVSRVRGYFLLDFLIKMEKNPKTLKHVKQVIQEAVIELKKKKGLSGVRVNIDVDPF